MDLDGKIRRKEQRREEKEREKKRKGNENRRVRKTTKALQ